MVECYWVMAALNPFFIDSCVFQSTLNYLHVQKLIMSDEIKEFHFRFALWTSLVSYGMEMVDGILTNTERLNRILREGLVSEDNVVVCRWETQTKIWYQKSWLRSNYHRKKMWELSLISQSALSFRLPRFKIWQMKNLSFDYNWYSIYFVLFEIKIFPIKHELTLCLGKFCWGSINFMHVIWNWNIVMSLFLVSC